uniref:Uncharacterized protein n=1 Tax=Cyprinus carpio TaxID=7962 RepID=A0A8C1VYH7_CYPCA
MWQRKLTRAASMNSMSIGGQFWSDEDSDGNSDGEDFFYVAQSVAVPGSRSTVHITTRQLIQLFFSSQALIHCKSIPTLEYGFLVQVMKYSEQRIPTLNDYSVVCDEQHVFQNGSMLKPAVCHVRSCRRCSYWS